MTKTFDRYPYLKHSTVETMPFKPAHKDTHHPAGQVINEEASQKTLSDYIRSINRTQAFDDIAAEKKLTFDEWYFMCFGDAPDGIGYHPKRLQHSQLKECWNTALSRGKVS